MTRWHTISRASCRLHVFTSSFDWFAGIACILCDCHSDNVCFGSSILNWNHSVKSNWQFKTREIRKTGETAAYL